MRSENRSVTSLSRAQRQRTAIERDGLSRPVSVALANGLITTEATVFDYGCGRGGDVQRLRSLGIQTNGWDPFFAPDNVVAPADVVNLGYVLNVIDDPAERVETLWHAFRLARRLLLVAVRIEHGIDEIPELREGVFTENCTFQKYYAQHEFLRYLESTLGRRVHVPVPGVAFVFKHSQAEQQYVTTKTLSTRHNSSQELNRRFREDPRAKNYVSLARTLGRLPRPEEYPEYSRLVENFGSYARVRNLATHALEPKVRAKSRAARRSDLLVFAALLRLQGVAPPKLDSLPVAIREDIRFLFGSYKGALSCGEHLLVSIGNSATVKAALAGSEVGKRLPGYLYVHRLAEEALPALVRVAILVAKRIVGEVKYDVAKIAADGKSVSFLLYPDFETVGHPALARSVRVRLPKCTCEVIDYASRKNPPVLHRKDALVSKSHSLYSLFRRLTEQEEAAGLLDSGAIGLRDTWAAMLSSRGLKVEGHALLSSSASSP